MSAFFSLFFRANRNHSGVYFSDFRYIRKLETMGTPRIVHKNVVFSARLIDECHHIYAISYGNPHPRSRYQSLQASWFEYPTKNKRKSEKTQSLSCVRKNLARNAYLYTVTPSFIQHSSKFVKQSRKISVQIGKHSVHCSFYGKCLQTATGLLTHAEPVQRWVWNR